MCNNYSNIFHRILVAIFSLFCIHGFATDWDTTEVVDPISEMKIKVYRSISSGSYIYDWDSKYDGIYWPLTDECNIRFNTQSGYIAFGSDFENIADDAKEKVREFLLKNYDSTSPPETHLDKIIWLGKVYGIRGASEEFFIKHACLMCYLARDDEKRNLEYRSVALEKIEKHLKKTKPSQYSAHLQIVAGFYNLLLGNNEMAKKYWESAKNMDLGIENPEEKGRARKYLDTIIEDISTGKYKEDYNSGSKLSGSENRNSFIDAGYTDAARSLHFGCLKFLRKNKRWPSDLKELTEWLKINNTEEEDVKYHIDINSFDKFKNVELVEVGEGCLRIIFRFKHNGKEKEFILGNSIPPKDRLPQRSKQREDKGYK